jgi:hypothetical protein
MSLGIDYGMKKTNINLVTKIRYGVIPYNFNLLEFSQEFEPIYGEIECDCPKCGEKITGYIDDDLTNCEYCKTEIDFNEVIQDMEIEPENYLFKNKEYFCHYERDSCDIFVEKSPYYTYAQFCSPCAPGACYLLNPLSINEENENNRVYCLGHECFDEGIAPYRVYSVKTNELIEP